MKRLLLFTMLLLATLPMMAELTAKEREFRSQVQSHIRYEGYTPSIDSDGSIEFKYQGKTYWVDVTEYKNGFYVDIYTGIVIEDDQYAAAIIAANKSTREYKFLRAYLTSSNDAVYIKMGGYFMSISQFKDVFNSWLNVVSDERIAIYNSIND